MTRVPVLLGRRVGSGAPAVVLFGSACRPVVCGKNAKGQSQPAFREIRMASIRFRALTFAIALDR
jgi:hypothetical protein